MKLRAIVAAAFLAHAALLGAAPNLLCVSANGSFDYRKGCTSRVDFETPVTPAASARKYVWICPSQQVVVFGILPAGATSADLEASDVMIGGSRRVVGPEGTPATVILHSADLGTWTAVLDDWWFREGRLNIRAPRSVYNLTMSADGKELYNARGIWFLDAPARRSAPAKPHILLRGRAVGADHTTPGDFAEILGNCRDRLCTTSKDGTFQCEIASPPPAAVCIDHPRLGRAWIEIDPKAPSFDAGVVTLIHGAAVRVIRPPYVDLPRETNLSLLRDGSLVKEEPLRGREIVEFGGLPAGKYEVLVAGPAPLQRRVFPVIAAANGDFEVLLAIERFSLTGQVKHGVALLQHAKVQLTGKRWRATLEADETGWFESEAWDETDYAVIVSAPELKQPYGVMKNCTRSDHHWELEIPKRRIYGTISDASSGKLISDASLAMESNSAETRRSRRIDAAADGSFEIDGVGEGTYKLLPSAPGYLPGDPIDFTIGKADDDRKVSISLQRGKSIRVMVVDARGMPLPMALVMDSAGGGSPRVAVTGQDGTATIAVGERSSGPLFVLPRAGSFALVQVPAELPSEPLRVAVRDPEATLSLLARTKEGEPLPAVGYLLRFEGIDIPGAVLRTMAGMHAFPLVTDAQGRASIALLPPGRYDVAWQPPRGLVGANRWIRVDVPAGETELKQTFSSP